MFRSVVSGAQSCGSAARVQSGFRPGLFLSWLFLIVLSTTVGAQTALTPGGTGTASSPYIISQLGHLVWMQEEVDSSAGKYYVLANAIDASDTANWNDDQETTTLEGFHPIGTTHNSFKGNFNGNGYAISSLTVNRPDSDYVGLFGYIGQGGRVRNLAVKSGSFTGRGQVGGLAGYNAHGTIENCFSSSKVTGSTYAAGGLVGANGGNIQNCYATGAVTGVENVGGLAGWNNSDGGIRYCYATGAVSGTAKVGGFTGGGTDGTIVLCFWDMDTTGQDYTADSHSCYGWTTAEMKLQSTYVGWDFENVWSIGSSYPTLQAPRMKLDLLVLGPGVVTGTGGTYPVGTQVTLTATPNANCRFVGWTGDVAEASRGANPLVVTMNRDKAIRAQFTSDLYAYRYKVKPVNCTVTGGVDGSYILVGQAVTVSGTSAASSLKIVKEKTLKTAAPATHLLDDAAISTLTISGDFGAFYSEAAIGGLTAGGAVKSITTKAAVERIEAQSVGTVRVTGQADSSKNQTALLTILTPGTDRKMTVALNGVVLRELVTAQEVGKVTVASKVWQYLDTKVKTYSQGGVGGVGNESFQMQVLSLDALSVKPVTFGGQARGGNIGTSGKPERMVIGVSDDRVQTIAGRNVSVYMTVGGGHGAINKIAAEATLEGKAWVTKVGKITAGTSKLNFSVVAPV
jgi:hypothetical protein